MQLHQLAYALAVAEERSFTQAAIRLHLAQPSLSRQVRLLEHELGVLLFNRGPGQGPVTLTPDGAALLPFMKRVLADVEATITGLIREALSHPSGPLAGACERAGQFLRGWWGEPPSPPYAPES